VKGKIESLSPVEWVVSGVIVRLTSNTTIEGSPEIGRSAEVKGYLMSDSSLQAKQIKVKNQKGAPESQKPTEEEKEETRPADNQEKTSATQTATRTLRPERTRTETEEPEKTPEPSKTPEPEKPEPGRPGQKSQTIAHAGSIKPTEND
jgi:hypothetical protein